MKCLARVLVVPFAEHARRIPVVAQDLRHECGTPRDHASVARETCSHFDNDAGTDTVMVAAGQQKRRVWLHRAVMWKRVYFNPLLAKLSILGVGTGPPNVEHIPNPTSSKRMIKTLGLPGWARFGGG